MSVGAFLNMVAQLWLHLLGRIQHKVDDWENTY